jgi:hypothetical protein
MANKIHTKKVLKIKEQWRYLTAEIDGKIWHVAHEESTLEDVGNCETGPMLSGSPEGWYLECVGTVEQWNDLDAMMWIPQNTEVFQYAESCAQRMKELNGDLRKWHLTEILTPEDVYGDDPMGAYYGENY